MHGPFAFILHEAVSGVGDGQAFVATVRDQLHWDEDETLCSLLRCWRTRLDMIAMSVSQSVSRWRMRFRAIHGSQRTDQLLR